MLRVAMKSNQTLTPARSLSERVNSRQTVAETGAAGHSVVRALLFPHPIGRGEGPGEGFIRLSCSTSTSWTQ